MTASDAVETEKKVSWAELFFDLVFVIAVTRVSQLLEHDHSWGGLLEALIVFVPIYWLWVGTAILTNLSDTSSSWPSRRPTRSTGRACCSRSPTGWAGS